MKNNLLPRPGLWAAALGLLVLGIWGATTGFAPPSDRSLRRVYKRGALRVGYAVTAPFAFVDTNGQVTGAFPEMTRRIAHQLGVDQIEWQQVEFSELLSGLESGRYDLVGSGMFITAERALRANFSKAVCAVKPALLVEKDNPFHLGSYRQAATTPHLTIAVIHGSLQESTLLKLSIPTARLLKTPDLLTASHAMRSGQAGALALSEPELRWLVTAKALKNMEIVVCSDLDVPVRETAFVFPKSSTLLREAWDEKMGKASESAAQNTILSDYGFGAHSGAELEVQAAVSSSHAQP